ncbi:class I SAM-dependent methyltransferase [[Eubacterium] cellulosolvens]
MGVWSLYYPYFYRVLSGFLANPVLDIGAASGDWIMYLETRGIQCYGLDLDPRSRTVSRASANRMPFRNKTFGAVTMMEVLEHISHRESFEVFIEVQRILKRGGVLFITTPNDRGIRKKIRNYLGFEWRESGGHVNLYTVDTLECQLLGLGFKKYLLETFPLYLPLIGRFKPGLKMLYLLRRWGRYNNSFIIAIFRK